MHVITSSTRIPPPTPPPIAAATEDEIELVIVAKEGEIEVGFVEEKSMEKEVDVH